LIFVRGISGQRKKTKKTQIGLLTTGYAKKTEKIIKEVKISTCPASKTTCQEDRTMCPGSLV